MCGLVSERGDSKNQNRNIKLSVFTNASFLFLYGLNGTDSLQQLSTENSHKSNEDVYDYEGWCLGWGGGRAGSSAHTARLCARLEKVTAEIATKEPPLLLIDSKYF